MSLSEKILEEIIAISLKNRTGIFEAAADYCVEHDLEQSDFIGNLDNTAIEMLKADAMSKRKVRQCVQPRVASLI